MDIHERARRFLAEQEILTIATVDGDGALWAASVFHCPDEEGRILFISEEGTEHGTHLKDRPSVAFATACHDSGVRRGIQGVGACREARGPDIALGVRLHNERFPALAEQLTERYLHENPDGTRVYVITPSRIKYWDDETLGPQSPKELRL